MEQVLYTIKVWFTTIITGSALFTVYDLFIASRSPISAFFGAIFPLLIANWIVGLPALLVFYIACERLNFTYVSNTQKRWVVIAIAFAIFLLSWFGLNGIFGRNVLFSTDSHIICGIYLATIITSCLLYEEKSSEKE